MQPVRLTPSDDMQAVLDLLRESFAYMEGRIDPPSSLGRMTAETLAQEAAAHELWTLPGPIACMILTPKTDHLYIGKLATAAARRGEGLARRMLNHADLRARVLGLPQLRLQTRIELGENHAAFRRMGFIEIARTAHPGFDHPTSITFARETAP